MQNKKKIIANQIKKAKARQVDEIFKKQLYAQEIMEAVCYQLFCIKCLCLLILSIISWQVKIQLE
jgi:hypothetical protein